MEKQRIILIVLAVLLGVSLIILLVVFPGQKGQKDLTQGLLGGTEEKITFEKTPTEDWQNPENPIESPPLKESEIPADSIKLTVTKKGYSPETFEVQRGEKVVLTVINGDQGVHIFKFRDDVLSEVAIGVGSHDPIRAITFYAPEEPGEYEFFCHLPGHGETGIMVVR
ncbi:hypothetical protein AMJ50_02755 [Parcubacteria bacterium DG_74_3]|nr:MAG: hypothetical protein AMJ50_02755 [Parcubacteria bacterium DG_74_3]